MIIFSKTNIKKSYNFLLKNNTNNFNEFKLKDLDIYNLIKNYNFFIIDEPIFILNEKLRMCFVKRLYNFDEIIELFKNNTIILYSLMVYNDGENIHYVVRYYYYYNKTIVNILNLDLELKNVYNEYIIKKRKKIIKNILKNI